MMFRGVNLVMAVLGFAFSTMFISFICIRLIVAQIQIATSRSNRSSLECGMGGLEPHPIAHFPTIKYRDAMFHASDDSLCVICLAEYHKENTLRILPSCGHYFHVSCIDKWLNQHSTCPICRISVSEISKPRMPPMYSSSYRPHYHVESHDFNHYCFLSAIQECSIRSHIDRRIDPIRENLLQVERLGEGTGQSVSVVKEGPINKYVGSPSNV